MIFEATINVQNLCVRILFDEMPSVRNVIDAIQIIFESNVELSIDLTELLTNLISQDTVFQVGEDLTIFKDGESVGSLSLQTRTLFKVLECS